MGAIFDRFESLALEEKTTLLSLFDPGQYKVIIVLKVRSKKLQLEGLIRLEKGQTRLFSELEAIFVKSWFSG